MANQDTQQEQLIIGDEFEKALTSAAEIKNTNISICKTRNKNNYTHFYELMLASDKDIQSILDKKRSNRSDDDNKKIKEFKKNVSQMYRQVCDFIIPEKLEEGEEGKIQKSVKKLATIVKMMQYIGHTEIEDEFKKYGIELKYEKLENDETFAQDYIKDDVKDIFEKGKNIREDINRNNEDIKTNIYENSVPVDLQYDKNTNPTGIKSTDFCKLVDLKAKLMTAQDDTAKEKVEDAANTIAGDYVFQNKRNSLISKKLIEIASSADTQG